MAPAKTKKTPERRCVGCGEHKPKSSMIRVVRSPEGDVSLDLTGKKSGRGAYVCKNADCLRRAVKSRALARNLGVAVGDDIAEALAAEIEAVGDADA